MCTKRPPLPAVLCLCLAFLLITGCQRSEAPHRPNVLWVSIDTLRADHLSAYGYSRETSPFLDEFSREAALFENAYALAAHTLPSHMSMMTSRFPAAHGVDEETPPLVQGITTFAEVLQQAGYDNAGFYAIAWLSDEFGFSRGFDEYRTKGFGRLGGVESSDAALGFLRDAGKSPDRPFFLFLHLRDVHCGPVLDSPHQPMYNAPQEFRDAFLPQPDVRVPYLPLDIWQNKVELTDEERRTIVARYDGGILYADTIVRGVFEEMKALGVYDETLIVVSSDHGESLGEHDDYGLHGAVWEEGLRIPLLFKHPESHPDRPASRGVRWKQRVRSIDVAPSILHVLGLPVPETFQGRDLFEGTADRDVVAHKNEHVALIRGRHKLKLSRLDDGSVELALFDLSRDPDELTDLREEEPALTRQLLNALRSMLREQTESFAGFVGSAEGTVELDEERLRQLRDLGYLDKTPSGW